MVYLWVSFSSLNDLHRELGGVPRGLGALLGTGFWFSLPESHGQEIWLGGAKEEAMQDQGSY